MIQIASKILNALPLNVPTSEIMEALNAVMASVIIQASSGSDLEQSKLLSVVQSDLAEKVGGVN